MDPECTCGHGGSRHHEEQPYPCHECDCRAFTISGALSMSAPRPEGLTLKWGTLKGWDLDESGPAFAALKRYHEVGPVAFGAAQQHDTPEQKQAICEIIDALNAEVVHLDWDDIDVSKDAAKKYVMEYRR